MPSKKAAYIFYQLAREPPISGPDVSAAETVISTPMLLSNILLQLCDQETVDGVPLKEPVKQLFVSKRVCKIFRNTIRGSIALRRHMWLQPPKPTTSAEICASKKLQDLYLRPLEWLFEMIGNPLITRDRDPRCSPAFSNGMQYKHYVSFQFTAGDALEKCNQDAFKYENASWRHMMACQALPEEPTIIDLYVSEWISVGHGEDIDKPHHWESFFDNEQFKVDGGDTLGVVFKKFVTKGSKSDRRQVEAILEYMSEHMGARFEGEVKFDEDDEGGDGNGDEEDGDGGEDEDEDED